MKIHNDHECKNDYHIKGPMGRGIILNTTGTHVAFTCGTGCLAFMDLVALLLKHNIMIDDVTNYPFEPNFKFIFYVSFSKKEDCIGFELCDGLNKICQQYELTNFSFRPRFSNIDKARWD
jgi:hypothetical protein